MANLYAQEKQARCIDAKKTRASADVRTRVITISLCKLLSIAIQ
jgi:hypothetical protein